MSSCGGGSRHWGSHLSPSRYKLLLHCFTALVQMLLFQEVGVLAVNHTWPSTGLCWNEKQTEFTKLELLRSYVLQHDFCLRNAFHQYKQVLLWRRVPLDFRQLFRHLWWFNICGIRGNIRECKSLFSILLLFNVSFRDWIRTRRLSAVLFAELTSSTAFGGWEDTQDFVEMNKPGVIFLDEFTLLSSHTTEHFAEVERKNYSMMLNIFRSFGFAVDRWSQPRPGLRSLTHWMHTFVAQFSCESHTPLHTLSRTRELSSHWPWSAPSIHPRP